MGCSAWWIGCDQDDSSSELVFWVVLAGDHSFSSAGLDLLKRPPEVLFETSDRSR